MLKSPLTYVLKDSCRLWLLRSKTYILPEVTEGAEIQDCTAFVMKTTAKIKNTDPMQVLTTIKTTILFCFFPIPIGVLAVLSMKNVDKVLVKGQLISKCPFGVFKLTKKTTKFL